jgi:hypothetical protein
MKMNIKSIDFDNASHFADWVSTVTKMPGGKRHVLVIDNDQVQKAYERLEQVGEMSAQDLLTYALARWCVNVSAIVAKHLWRLGWTFDKEIIRTAREFPGKDDVEVADIARIRADRAENPP